MLLIRPDFLDSPNNYQAPVMQYRPPAARDVIQIKDGADGCIVKPVLLHEAVNHALEEKPEALICRGQLWDFTGRAPLDGLYPPAFNPRESSLLGAAAQPAGHVTFVEKPPRPA